MHSLITPFLVSIASLVLCIMPLRDSAARDVARPEEIRSKRQVIYDKETYDKLAKQWQAYYKEFPSEYAYANWMYAARYAGWEDYQKLLNKGLKKYSSNPKLLYLAAVNVGMGEEQKRNQDRLERAVALDPDFVDPWFSLVGVYMYNDDDERTNLALRRLLESGIIADCIMDYNYNTLIGLDSNAVLITNGDNDTYPAWILTRILKIRPDVSVINRSLLNTEWYPPYVMKRGAPRFITPDELVTVRSSVMQDLKAGRAASPESPFGDTLIARIVEAGQRDGRPVYFAATLYSSPVLDRLAKNARQIGLAALVTSSSEDYSKQLHRYFATWLASFRSGGLDSWMLRSAPESDAARMIMPNYAHGLVKVLDELRTMSPDRLTELFRWYIAHIEPILNEQKKSGFGQEWCKAASSSEIRSWCEKQGYSR